MSLRPVLLVPLLACLAVHAVAAGLGDLDEAAFTAGVRERAKTLDLSGKIRALPGHLKARGVSTPDGKGVGLHAQETLADGRSFIWETAYFSDGYAPQNGTRLLLNVSFHTPRPDGWLDVRYFEIDLDPDGRILEARLDTSPCRLGEDGVCYHAPGGYRPKLLSPSDPDLRGVMAMAFERIYAR